MTIIGKYVSGKENTKLPTVSCNHIAVLYLVDDCNVRYRSNNEKSKRLNVLSWPYLRDFFVVILLT